jgi:radical SAM protein with 4Fe4S-binding SPASM domain
MDEETLKAVSLKYPSARRIIFHGGEPTLMGVNFLKRAIEILGRKVFLLQTNLIYLDSDLINLLKEHFGSSIGTSLDTSRLPFLDRILRNVTVLKENGIEVGAILTVTNDLTTEDEIFVLKKFSEAGGSSFSLQFVTPVKGEPVEPSRYVEIFMELYSHPLNKNRQRVISALCGHISGGINGGNCARWIRTIEPDGTIYVCPDLAGQRILPVGNVLNGGEEIDAPGIRLFNEREKKFSLSCFEECWRLCRGGCFASTFLGDREVLGRDPYCEAYREIFRRIKGGE